MKRLASIVLLLFVANLAFAAVGPHCATGITGSGTQSADLHNAVPHDHGDHHPQAPEKSPGEGEACASMQLAAVLAGVTIPGAPQVETTVIWTAAQFVVTVDPSPVEQTGIPPPPLIAAGYDTAYAKTGRLLI